MWGFGASTSAMSEESKAAVSPRRMAENRRGWQREWRFSWAEIWQDPFKSFDFSVSSGPKPVEITEAC